VVLRLDDVPRDSLVLRAYASSDFIRLRDLAIFTPDGRRLPSRTSLDEVETGGRILRLPRVHVPGPLPSRLVVSYQASAEALEGNSHTGFTGKRPGYLGGAFGLILGRDLFLLPDAHQAVRHVDVGFTLPPGWTAITPWERRDGRYLPGIRGRFAAEHLISAAIGLGHFRETRVPIGATSYRFAFESSIPESLSTRMLADLEGASRVVGRWMGRSLGSTYTTIVIPDSPEGDEIEGEGWATGQGRSLAPLTPGRIRTFARGLLEAYLVHEPFRSEIRDAREYWLVDAVLHGSSWLAAVRVGALDEADLQRQAARAYLEAVKLSNVERDLEKLYESQLKTRLTREAIAPFLLTLFDQELRHRSQGRLGVENVLPLVFSKPRARSLWAALPGGPRAWRTFRERYVRGTEVAPVSRLFALGPVRPRPDPPGGPAVSRLTLVFTGNTYGYLENCGCKSNQSGGVARRSTVLREIRKHVPEALLIDAGNAFPHSDAGERPSFLTDEEQRLYLATMSQAGYRASAIGRTELLFGARHFRALSAGATFPFLAANVFEGGQALAPATTIVRAGSHRVGMIGIYEPPSGPDAESILERSSASLTFLDPIRTLKEKAPALRREADLIVVIGRLTPATVRRVATECRGIDVIVSTEDEAPIRAGGDRDSVVADRDEPGFIGPVLVLYTSLANYGVAQALLDLDPSGRIVAASQQPFMLTDQVADDADTRSLLNRFYDRVGRDQAAAASVVPPFTGDVERMNGSYVGAGRCAACHASEFAQWKSTPHASAFKTLLDRHRNFQPRCVACHVVAFGASQGYRLGDPETALANVQCEVCHGPGAAHARLPSFANIRRQVPVQVCLACHTPDHSDRFVYEERIPKVRHLPPGGERLASGH